ncbi:MAG: beta-lactamase regulating signal transducer with metallopeptidase domain [Planctomycetota bacterium]|jgi:beta-lactamase regulating signal transducer with metallopeptidase domain
MAPIIELSETLGRWLTTYWIHSTVLLLLAQVASRPLRSHQLLEPMWRAALFGGVLTATLHQVALLPNGASLASLSLPSAIAIDALPGTEAAPAMAVISANAPATSQLPSASHASQSLTSQRSIAWPSLLGYVWMVGAALGLLRLRSAHRHLKRGLDRQELDAAVATEQLQRLAKRAGITHRLRLSTSAELSSPIAIGTREICVPRATWDALDDEQREGLLAHELAHLMRRDPRWLARMHAMQSVFFLQPLNRLACRNLADAAEHACDDWAIRATRKPIALASCLAAVAERLHARHQPLLAPAMARTHSPLITRVSRLLAEPAGPPSTRASLSVTIGSALVLLAVACAGPDFEEQSEIDLADAPQASHKEFFAAVHISPNGVADLDRHGELLSRSDLSTDEGLTAMRSSLAQLASMMPRGLSVMPRGQPAFSFPNARLRILVAQDTPYRHVQRLMALCGSMEVSIWNLELAEDVEGSEVFRIPLPHTLHEIPEEIIEEVFEIEEPIEEEEPEEKLEVQLLWPDEIAEPIETPNVLVEVALRRPRLEVRLKPDAKGVVQYRLGSNHWDLGQWTAESDLTKGQDGLPFDTANTNAAGQLLKQLAAANADQQVTIDARSGIVYQDVKTLMDQIIAAGFTHIVFMGSYE